MLGGPVCAAGLSLVGVVAATGAPHHDPSEPWFDLGIVLAALGAIGLAWALILFIAHQHAERHIAAALSTTDGREKATEPDPKQTSTSQLHEQRETAAIARLLSGELEEAQDKLHVAVNTHEWWSLSYSFPTAEWEKYRDRLALTDGNAHKAVRDAYRKLGELNRRQRARLPTHVGQRPNPVMNANELSLAGEAFQVVLNAKEHLDKLERDAMRQARP
jgi:hypothetical protein